VLGHYVNATAGQWHLQPRAPRVMLSPVESPNTPPIILQINNPNLTTDPATRRAVKDEKVAVEFAVQAGELISAVGVNRYSPGDALITGSTGDRWCVSRDRFDAKYDPEPPTARGEAGAYRNRPVTVLAKRMDKSFTVARMAGGDSLSGSAGDWLIQYAPGDYGIVERTRFERVYRIIEDERH
jgi:hypothetical protein